MSKVLFLQSPPPKFEEIQKEIFNNGAVEFLSKLHEKFDERIEQLYKERLRRTATTKVISTLDFKNSFERNDKTWKIAPLPPRLQNRHLDLGDVSASNTAHFVSSLTEDVQGVQVDFDDGHCPTWRNQLQAYQNIWLVVNGRLQGAPVTITTCPVLMLRPRAWNIIEHNILINGKEAVGPLVDFAILMYHNAKKLHEANSGPYFYLSKLEGASEAVLWNDIFIWAQEELGLPQGTIKACVLIENVISSFELDEILYALREHSLGLNCGIWDYCASIISKFGDRENFLLPDRNKYVNMERHFLNSYLRLVVSTCHAREAPATGGMAAAMLKPGTDGTDKQSKMIITNILKSKMKEIELGVDGFMVYDARVVPHVNELWKKSGATPNQIWRKFEVNIKPQDLLNIPRDGVTLQGLKHNVAISILFIYYWLAGIGHFFYSGNVEDSATAEISRFQIWQWIRFAPPLEDDPTQNVTASLVEKTASSFAAHAHKNLCRSNAERKRLTAARYMSMELFLTRNPPEFITSYLNDNHKFRTLHNKALLSDRENFLLPDRNKYVNMERHFLNSYLRLVVSTCHAREAPATGGMAAAMLKPGTDGTDKQSKMIITNILKSKMKEIELGVDGFMVYDARVVPHVNELWKKSGATPNQIWRKFEVNIKPQDLLNIPRDGVTLQGLKHNVAISILFIYYWLAGIGHFFYSGNVEDSATAEISRFQIWQWIRFAPPLEDDPTQNVTASLVEKTASSFAAHAHKNLCRSNAERKRLTAARYMSMELFLTRNPPEFITSYLNDNHKFRTLHNKALLSNL